MKKLVFVLLIFLTIYSCNNNQSNPTEPSHLIPEHTGVVLKIESLEAFKSDLKNNTFIKELSSTDLHNDLFKPFEILDALNTDSPILVCFESNEDQLNYSIITKYHDSLFNTIAMDSLPIYSKIIDSIYMGSTSKALLDPLALNINSKFDIFFQTAIRTASFSMFMNNETSDRLGKAIISEDLKAFANLMSMDAEITPDQIAFSGISIANDTLPQLIEVFKHTIPQENTIQNIAPADSEGFLSMSYNDFEILNQNLADYRQIPLDSITNYELFQTINEVGEIYYNNSSAVVLKSIDAIATREALQEEQNPVSEYRNTVIYEFTQPSFFRSVFYPLINAENISNYIVLDDYFIFAASEEALQDIISNYRNGTTIANQKAFIINRDSLSDESSLLVVANSSKLEQILALVFNDKDLNLKLDAYKSSAIQFVQDDDLVHVNGVIRRNRSSAQQNAITEEFNVALEADIMLPPQFVTNHRTRQKDVVVQDVYNNLYLISNTGKILWKKRLHGPVLGRIEQIDIYKNGRLQLAFATPHRVYVIDRLGRDVSPFPARFNDEITQPLSVFDYDNNKNYRLLVTQGREVLMYNVNARTVRGFTFRSASNAINHQPQHFRIGRKDYILIKTENRLHILDRTGRNRITPKTAVNYSGEAVYLYNNKFTTTSQSGDLVTIDMNGNTGIQNLNLSDSHHIAATSKTLVTLSDNNLNIRQKHYELDFGNYLAPKIYYLNDKIYITLTDLQTQKVYLFDSQSRLLSNFPVYGNSTMDLANIDSDNRLEFVVKGESNSIIVYKKN
jgi:hypothetical protein